MHGGGTIKDSTMAKKTAPSKVEYESVHYEVGANCACFAIRKASRLITQHYDHYLARVGLKTTQFTLLNAIGANKAMSMNALANGLSMDRTTLTRNLKPLQEHGFISLNTSPEDKRVKLFTLTPAGKKLVTTAIRHWREAHTDFLKIVGDTRWKRIAHDLNAAAGAFAPS